MKRKLPTAKKTPAPPVNRHQSAAKDEVFANGDLVYLFKDCFTKNNFALNKKFLRFAIRKQIDIKPVAVRANVDLHACSEASYGLVPLKICDIEWPTYTDPTAEYDLMDFLLEQYDPVKFQAAVNRIRTLKTMARIIDTHAPHIRRLRVHMSLNVGLDYDPENAFLYEHINRFFAALEKCTAIESLTIVQTDYVAKDAKLATVQCRLFRIINSMQNLKVLDFSGNMTIEADGLTQHGNNPGTNHMNQLTMLDYLPPSLRELTIRDGPVCRMIKWKEFYGFSAGLKLIMNNYDNRVPSLKTISLPNSFWSLPAHVFGGFMRYLNSKHITQIGFSDAFKLTTGPTKPGLDDIMPLPAPYLMLHYLVAMLAIDMVVDLRGGCHVERHERIQWAMNTLETTSLLSAPTQSDGGIYTTVIIHKKNNATVRVLI
jgi:hypothetical protein